MQCIHLNFIFFYGLAEFIFSIKNNVKLSIELTSTDFLKSKG